MKANAHFGKIVLVVWSGLRARGGRTSRARTFHGKGHQPSRDRRRPVLRQRRARPAQDRQGGRRGAEGLRRRRAVPRIRPEREPGVRRRQAEERRLRHHPGLRPARGFGRSDRLQPRLGARREGAEARGRHGEGGARRQRRHVGRIAARHQPAALCRRQPDRRRGLREEGRSCCRRSTPTCAARSPRRARSRSRCRAPGRWSRSSAPAAGAPPTCGRWCGSTSAWSAPTASRMEAGSTGSGRRAAYGDIFHADYWKKEADEAIRQALVNLEFGRRRRPARCRWCCPRHADDPRRHRARRAAQRSLRRRRHRQHRQPAWQRRRDRPDQRSSEPHEAGATR